MLRNHIFSGCSGAPQLRHGGVTSIPGDRVEMSCTCNSAGARYGKTRQQRKGRRNSAVASTRTEDDGATVLSPSGARMALPLRRRSCGYSPGGSASGGQEHSLHDATLYHRQCRNQIVTSHCSPSRKRSVLCILLHKSRRYLLESPLLYMIVLLCTIVTSASPIGPAMTAPPARDCCMQDILFSKPAAAHSRHLRHDVLLAGRSSHHRNMKTAGSGAAETQCDSDSSSGCTHAAAGVSMSMVSSPSTTGDGASVGPGSGRRDAYLSGDDLSGSHDEPTPALTPLDLQSPADSPDITHPLLQLPPLALPGAPAWEHLAASHHGQETAHFVGHRRKRGRRSKECDMLAHAVEADACLKVWKRQSYALAIGNGADTAVAAVAARHVTPSEGAVPPLSAVPDGPWHDSGMGMGMAAGMSLEETTTRGRVGRRGGGNRVRGSSGRGNRGLRHCAHVEGCDKMASFGDPSNPVGELFCKQHKGHGHCNVVSKRCNSPGLSLSRTHTPHPTFPSPASLSLSLSLSLSRALSLSLSLSRTHTSRHSSLSSHG